MVLMTSFPSGAVLERHQECALSQVGTCSDMNLDVARMENNNKETHRINVLSCVEPTT